jgi:hypothetical protein
MRPVDESNGFELDEQCREMKELMRDEADFVRMFNRLLVLSLPDHQ